MGDRLSKHFDVFYDRDGILYAIQVGGIQARNYEKFRKLTERKTFFGIAINFLPEFFLNLNV